MGRRILIAALALVLTQLSTFSVECSQAKSSLPVEIGIVVTVNEQTVAGEEQAAAAERWLRAAREQGLPASLVTADDVSSDWRNQRHRFAALVLPDGLAVTASQSFVDGLRRFVENGGRLLVVFDAALLDPQGEYALDRSVLSNLLGVGLAAPLLRPSAHDKVILTLRWHEHSSEPGCPGCRVARDYCEAAGSEKSDSAC